MTKTLALGVIASLTVATAWAQNDSASWPRWRGPLETGVAPQGNPPTEFGEDKNLRWKVAIPGNGSGSPIVWGDKLFLLSAVEGGDATASLETQAATESVAFQETLRPLQQQNNDQPIQRRPGDQGGRPGGRGFGGGAAPAKPLDFVVMCLDRNSGKTLWKQTARSEKPHEGKHDTNSFASASAVTDGKHVFCSFGSRGIYCYDMNGKKVWEKDLGDMQTRAGFGEGATPALFGDTLVIPWDHEGQSFVAALSAKNGDEKWRVERDEVTTWATPLIVPRGNGQQVDPQWLESRAELRLGERKSALGVRRSGSEPDSNSRRQREDRVRDDGLPRLRPVRHSARCLRRFDRHRQDLVEA